MKSLKLTFIFWLLLFTLSANGTSLRDSIETTLNSNPSILAEHLNRKAYEMYIYQEEADYLPTLDLDAFAEKSKTYDNPDTPPPAKGWSEKDGWNAVLKFEHVLYDGGLTPSEAQEYRHIYNSNKYRSINDVEQVILDTVKAYSDLVSKQELIALSKNNIKIHEEYLTIAKEKEEISGEVLETHQVNSKYHSVIDRFLEQENEHKKALSLYKKLVGKDLDGNICRPIMNKSFLPPSLKEAIEVGVRRSFKIKEQIEKIKEQREKIVQEQSTFRPTIKFQLQGQWDDDLELAENGREDIYRARVLMSWNLFNGGKNYYMTQKEKLFLKEEQKRLDETTADIVDKIKESYETYYNLEKRIENINKYVDDNFNILVVYKKQLADGTRTFIDILNAEAELYRSDIDKIQQEFDYINAYYNLLFNMSILSDVILMQEKQTCNKYTYIARKTEEKVNPKEEFSTDLLNMFDDTKELNSPTQETTDTNIKDKIPTSPTIDTEINIDDRLNDIYNDEKTTTPKIETLSLDSEEEQVHNNSKVKYTLNVATFKSEALLKKFIQQSSIKNKGLLETYRFGKNGDSIKLLYGRYTSIQEAKQTMQKLCKCFVSGAYIDNMNKHNNLRTKYAQYN